MKYALTNPQQSIWLTEQFYANTSVNNICGYVFVSDTIQLNVLDKAIHELVKTNDSMRIQITEDKTTCEQFVSKYRDFKIERLQLSSPEAIEQKALELANIPFDLENSPLFRFVLFELPTQSGGFIVTVHHLISDSWTLGLVAKEVTGIYADLIKGGYVEKEYPSYWRYIEYENDYINSDKYQKDKAFWDSIFGTVPEVASIPSIKSSRTATSSCEGNRKKFILPELQIKKIKGFCTDYKISVYNFFMAVYSLYLGRVSNLDDFVIGTPILNRSNFEQKHTMGMFISTAPLRIALNHELSFSDFCKEIGTNTLSVLRHQRYPYQTILEDLRKKDSSLPNLYNVILSYQITKTIEENSDVHYTTDWIFNGNCADDLQIHLFDLNDENAITVAYDYKTEKYDEQDITDLHNRILTMIEQVIANNEILLKNIEIVTPEEKHKILYEFNNTKVDYPRDKTIVDLFEEQVEKTPDNIAVVFEDQKLTYKELNERANQLSNYLLTCNLLNQKNIGIFAHRSLDTIVGILAILKIGATFVPIDPLYPKERIDYMITTSQLEFILDASTSTVNSSSFSVIHIAYSKYLNYPLDFKIKSKSRSQNNLYIIFTSGSTGAPKGLTLSHKNMINLICFEKKHDPFLSEGNVILQFATMSFDVSYQEIFSTLLSGCTLVLIDELKRKNMALLIEHMVKNSVTTLFIPPAYLRLLVEDEKNIDALSKCVKYIITAGESLLISSGIQKLLQHDIKLFNHYGPAETHVATTYCVPKDINSTISPIGTPIHNSHIYILDTNNLLCPPNVPGQIAIGGDCVGNGYINNQTLNNEKFINDIINPSEKMYLTGDIGFIDSNNILHYIGRNDFQVKINGFRIELDEINKNILKYHNISSSCTVVKEYHSKKYIISYYTANQQIPAQELLHFLSTQLPKYMLPYQLIQLDSLPININGKIDKKTLPDIDFNMPSSFSIPSTLTEEKLLDLWKNILELSSISINDDFFTLGGDSLLAIKLIAFINTAFKINLTINDLFNNSTIETLGKYLDSLPSIDKNIIPKSESKKYYPLSSAQKRVYYASSLDCNSTLYNIAGGIIVDKTLDVKKLEKCFITLIKRHSALRTHFDMVDNDLVQMIDEKIHFKLTLEKASTDDLNQIYTDFVKPFDLAKAPLFRTKLVELKNNKMLLLLDMHHSISDGTSLNILLQELCDLYNGLVLPEKEIDYKDFTLWEQEQFKTDTFQKSKEYWLSRYQDEIPLLNMPTNYPRPSVQSFEGSNYHTTLPKEVFEKVHDVAKKLNITPYMLLLSCYYILLSKYTSQDDLVVGTPIVGREMPELSNMLGMFVNTLALRNKVDSSLTFTDFSNMIKENSLDSFAHQNYPFDMLVKDLNITRDTSRNPLFDVMFVYQNNGYPTIHLKDTKTEYFIPDNNISKFDLTLEVIPMDNEYSLRFEYCTKLFNKDFITRLSSHYTNILNAILENTEIKIADIDMLSEEERHQILYDFNNTKVDYPRNKTIVDLFEEQVEKTPDNIAVVFEDQKLTYRELNEKANQLARFLLANNASLGDIVGILLDKSVESIISILGILKIGATFLPIDVNYPNERIDYMLRDSKATILLTNQSFVHKANDTAQPLLIELESNYFSQYDTHNLEMEYGVDNLAYIMYTSGSTGNPKGVMVTHQNIVRLVKNNRFITFDKNEHILQTGSIVFDACTFEIWGALLNGFELFIMKKEDLLDAYLLEQYLKKNKITTLWLTAPLFNQLCETNPSMFETVKKLLTGGDVLSPKHINAVRKVCPDLTIINGYGPTENTTFSCCFTIDKKYTQSIPIGKPISNSTAYIVSNSGHLCPIGVPGELWVGGDGVAKGYLNNENLTNEKFIDNPFGEGRIYKTGDLVKWLPNGNIEFMGRIDNQVKIRGFRVELSEINNQILENPLIKEAFTTIQTINNVKHICSYIVTKNDFDLEELKLELTNYLPDYMIPSYFVTLKKLPINQNGKVDKKALPKDLNQLVSIHSFKEASSAEENLLLSLFKKVLSNDNIGITDNFFEVGGDSLTAMKLQVEAISNDLNIAYADIFRYGTVEKIIKNLSSKKEVKNDYNTSYDKYNRLLANNTLAIQPLECAPTTVGNVLLTGFTGFLGAHILDSFLKKETGKIYCLIRDKNNMSARERLFNVLHFYFENKYDMLVDDRIILVEGDITFEHFGLSHKDYKKLGNVINTVIHSAALVKHYGIYKDFEAINVNGTKCMVDFAKDFHLKLLHISTISVSGNNLAEGSNIDNHFGKEMDYDESNFYIGQNLENLYVKSKFEAEKIVLDAIADGLPACILRMGNLTSRFSEGKFQQNHFENAFVNRLKSFLQIGVFPESLLSLYCEFTPIDYCGDAIINIASHFNPKYTVFHLLNEKHVYLDRLFKMIHEIGIDTKLVSDEEFAKVIQNTLNNPEKKQYIEGIVNDLTADKKLVYQSEVNIKSEFTKEFLYQTGFEWPYIDIHYIKNYFKYLSNIGYFNISLN